MSLEDERLAVSFWRGIETPGPGIRLSIFPRFLESISNFPFPAEPLALNLKSVHLSKFSVAPANN